LKNILAMTTLMIGLINPAYAITWQADTELSNFETTKIELANDYDGEAIATLIRQRNDSTSTKAVLYIHGYSDYFFQDEMAKQYIEHGYNFYALDLRKYGRSILEGQHPNMMKDISEYDEEITKAIEIIRGEEGNNKLLLAGHSTGGLISTIYANKFQNDNTIDAVFLNSPYFSETPLEKTVIRVGTLTPFLILPTPPSLKVYGKSLSSDYFGEWEFNQDWKPVENGDIPVYAGWLASVYKAQQIIHKGLNIKMPILVMHSKRSSTPIVYDKDKSTTTDTVLNVDAIDKYANNLGNVITKIRIEDGLHDLVLSRKDVREHVYSELFRWLDGYMK